MKFVALISGGKDSFFNILHCLKNGHELVALANLRPGPSLIGHELDSYLYQTVGHTVLDDYSKCLEGVPIYRGDILGKSLNLSLDYVPVPHDETEDLLGLLERIHHAHPEINAVSVGAILSSYQRTRVESVCNRLGLVCLAYLWQRSQAELLDEIIESGIDARIIKVAAIGLNEAHLGANLSEARPDLHKLHKVYGLHICGEGGEYETLVFDAPIFKQRLEPVSLDPVIHSRDNVAYLKLQMELRAKPEDELDPNWKIKVREPPLFDEEFQDIEKSIEPAVEDPLSSQPLLRPDTFNVSRLYESSVSFDGRTFYGSNLIYFGEKDVGKEISAIFDRLNFLLQERNLDFRHISFIQLILRSMDDFEPVNKVFKLMFKSPNPPARVCVASTVPNGCNMQMSAIAHVDWSKRRGLHVQSQSYWVPANIGPYSQAIMPQDGFVYLAGQIPLKPSNMSVIAGRKNPNESSSIQMTLPLQHLERVGCASGVVEFAAAVAYTTCPTAFNSLSKIWEARNKKAGFFSVVVSSLPRGASAEWWALGIHKDKLVTEECYDESDNEDNDEAADDSPTLGFYNVKDITGLRLTRIGTDIVLCGTLTDLKILASLKDKMAFLSATIFLNVNLLKSKLDGWFTSSSDWVAPTSTEVCQDIEQTISVEIVGTHAVNDSTGINREYGVILRGKLLDKAVLEEIKK